MANERRHAHKLIEQLPPHQLSAVVGLLEAMLDPIWRKLAAAPIDDEPETEDERRAVAESKEWLRQHGGNGIPHEEVLQDFGLTMEDFDVWLMTKRIEWTGAARADVRRIDRETAMRILEGLARFLVTLESNIANDVISYTMCGWSSTRTCWSPRCAVRAEPPRRF